MRRPPRTLGSSISRRSNTTARATPTFPRGCRPSRTPPGNSGGRRRPICVPRSTRFSILTRTACRRPRRCCRAMLDTLHIGLKVDVDTLRGTREGVPRLAALFKKHALSATFYFSVGPDNTGRALRRVFRKGFAKKVARTSVVKHYGIKTLMYGVLLPGPHIGREAGDHMRRVADSGFEVGLHTFDHVRWQDQVAAASAAWTRTEFERGMHAFKNVFGFFPSSHAAAGWQVNRHALELEREFSLSYASDCRGRTPFWPALPSG